MTDREELINQVVEQLDADGHWEEARSFKEYQSKQAATIAQLQEKVDELTDDLKAHKLINRLTPIDKAQISNLVFDETLRRDAEQKQTILQLQAEVKVMREALFKATNEVWWAKNASNDLCDMVTNVISTQPSTTLAEHDSKPDEYDMVLLRDDEVYITLDIANLTITQSGVKQFTLVISGGK